MVVANAVACGAALLLMLLLILDAVAPTIIVPGCILPIDRDRERETLVAMIVVVAQVMCLGRLRGI